MFRRIVLVACLGLAGGGCGGGGGGGGGGGVTVFRHLAAAATIVEEATFIDHPLLNGDPDAIFLVCPSLPGIGAGAYDDNAYGVGYYAPLGQWAVFHENTAPAVEDSIWNVCVPRPGDRVFVHVASALNTVADVTLIDHPDLNGDPSARFVATQNLNPGGAATVVKNDSTIGAFYDAGAAQWGIYNVTAASIPVGAAFNVFIPPASRTYVHTSTAASIVDNTTTLDHPSKNGALDRLCQYLHVYQYAGGVGLVHDHNTGLAFDGSDWAIFNQNWGKFDEDEQFVLYTP